MEWEHTHNRDKINRPERLLSKQKKREKAVLANLSQSFITNNHAHETKATVVIYKYVK